MNISSLSIKRPVMATVFSIVILLFGFVGFTFLGVRDFPSVDPPIVTVTTNYAGANADVIESQITEPLEESINGIAGIRSLSSVSSDGRSTITVEFTLNVDMEAASNDVRDRVSRAVRNLPADADPPIVAKADANSDPIVALTLQSDKRSDLEVTAIANDVFKERLQTIPGVSEIRIWGEKKYSMKLFLDSRQMAARGITPSDVRAALNRENIELPTGRIEGYNTELTIRTLGRLTTEKEFNDLIIKDENGSKIRLSQIGEAKLIAENERGVLRGNGGLVMAGVALTPQPGANYIAIADEFYKRVEKLKKEMPEDIHIGMAIDTTTTIRKSISEVEETIFIAFGLVVLVIFLFLRDWRTTLIPVIAIPVSLIGSFFIMYVADFSINILSLLGIVLATGLVVDDAIVVLENIYTKIEKGMDPDQAGHEGSQEIFFAIISTTITLAAVFLPIIFLQGLTGRLFREFGIVVAGSVIISAFVSLTLTPMMSSRFLRKKEKESWFFRVTEHFFEAMTAGYHKSLEAFLRVRWVALIVMLACGLLIFFVGKKIPSELAPMEDKGRFMLSATAPEGTSFEVMDSYMKQLLALCDTIPEKDALIEVTAPNFAANSAVNAGFIRVSLIDAGLRKRTQSEIANEVAAAARKYPLAKTFIIEEPTIGGGRSSGLPIQYVIQAPTFEDLKKVLPQFMEKVSADTSTFQVADLNLKFNKPELNVTINRDKARSMGVSVADVAEALQLFYSGQRYGYFIYNGKQYQVIGQARRDLRDEPRDLEEVFVRNNQGQMIQLSNLVTLNDQSNPPQLFRYNRYVSATVSAKPAGKVTLGQGIEKMNQIAAETLPDGFSTSLAGTSKEFAESSNSLLFAFLFALVLIYLILSAQFESFVDPLIIMFTVPLAIAGAVLSLWFFDHTLNIFSQIGIIVLVGIVTKNGILIVEFANQRKEEGIERSHAVIDAAVQRLRPILMTSLATALGAVPIAMALGAAAKSRIPMGTVIIGGLLFSLILTLYVIPALYSYMSSSKIAKKDSAQ